MVGHLEVVGEDGHQLRRAARGVLRPCGLAFGHHDPHRLSAAELSPVDALEGTHAEGEQVAGQRRRLRESDHFRIAFLPARFDRRVEECRRSLRHAQRDFPGNLEARLVEAGQHAPHAERLTLREYVPLAILLLPEEPLQIGAREPSLPVHLQRRLAGRQRLRELETDEAAPALHRRRFRLGVEHLQLVRVEPEDGRRCIEAQLQLARAMEFVL